MLIQAETRAGKADTDDINVAAIHKSSVPMPFDDRVLRVEMLIKEFRIRKDGDRLYTVESVEIEAPPTQTPFSQRPVME